MDEAGIKRGVLVEEVLRLLNQRWISATDIEGVTGKMGVPSDRLDVRIFVLNQVLEMYRKIPDQYFKDNEHRENILESAQEALDDLIEQEEEEEGFEDDDEDEDEDEGEDDFEMNFDI